MDPLVPSRAWNYGTVAYPVALPKDRADHYSLMPVNNEVPKLRWEGKDWYLGDLLGPKGRDLAYDYGSAAISKAEFEARLGSWLTPYAEMGEQVEVVWPQEAIVYLLDDKGEEIRAEWAAPQPYQPPVTWTFRTPGPWAGGFELIGGVRIVKSNGEVEDQRWPVPFVLAGPHRPGLTAENTQYRAKHGVPDPDPYTGDSFEIRSGEVKVS